MKIMNNYLYFLIANRDRMVAVYSQVRLKKIHSSILQVNNKQISLKQKILIVINNL